MGLEIVEFNPSDHNISAVLTSGTAKRIDKKNEISAIFSLINQWPDKTKISAYVHRNQSKAYESNIIIDNEERNITQLIFEFNQEPQEAFTGKLFAKISIFDSCFEIEVEVLECWKEDGSFLICTSIPETVDKLIPRASTRKNLTQPIHVSISIDELETTCRILNLNPGNVVIDLNLPVGQKIRLKIEKNNFHGKSIRHLEHGTLIEIMFESDEENGCYKEIYFKNKYPNLSSRDYCDPSLVFDAFIKSGFFGNFTNESNHENKKSDTIKTWENLKPIRHKSNIDMCLINNGQPVGASSLTLGLRNKQQEIWIFHQLFSIKSETTIDDTGLLYTWRAEYLMNRMADINTLVWFRSESRWIERIYVKLSMLVKSHSKLCHSNVFDYSHTRTEKKYLEVAKVEDFGSEKRATVELANTLASAGPRLLHVNENLNLVVSQTNDPEEIKMACDLLCDALNTDKMHFRLDVVNTDVVNALNNLTTQKGSDRRAEIEKSAMLDLITCVQHSVEVTKKKMKAG